MTTGQNGTDYRVDNQHFTNTTFYNDEVVYVNIINKPSIIMNRDDLLEMKQVRHKPIRTLIRS